MTGVILPEYGTIFHSESEARHLNVANLHVTFIPKNVKFVVVTQKDKNHIFSECKEKKLIICDLNSMGAAYDWFFH